MSRLTVLPSASAAVQLEVAATPAARWGILPAIAQTRIKTLARACVVAEAVSEVATAVVAMVSRPTVPLRVTNVEVPTIMPEIARLKL